MNEPLNIVVLTGAGISADSGVDTFRDQSGVWQKNDPMKVATPEGFAEDPARVHAFYNARRAQLPSVQPNAAHAALAELEDALLKRGGSLTLVTQNVDDLHQRAGSKNVLPIHGLLQKAECYTCGHVSEWTGDLSTETPCPTCQSLSMRPYIVWFGEIPRHFDEVEERMMDADLFVAIGTSGAVYPAAGLVGLAARRGIPRIELNLDPSDNAELFTDRRYGKASEVVPQWAADLLSA